MSVEAPKTVEETQPVETKAVPTETPAPTEAPIEATPEAPATTTPATDAAATNGLKKGETVVEATPASEGVLGYKAPGFLKQLYFSKHFFWFSDEALSSESLNAYIRSEKIHTVGHEHAAWARETGQGVLFYSKRAEDKSNPSGVILLHEVSNVTKEGLDAFSLKIGTHTHKFEAANSGERDSWIVAIEKKVEEGQGLKDDIHGRDSYKKNLEEYAKSPAQIVAAAGTTRSKSKEPKKSLDAATATAAPVATEAKTEETSTAAPVVAPVEEKKTAQKERSQSRKRASIFGSILGKKDEKETEHEAKKEAKAEDKAEKKAEKQAIKEEKKEEAAIKKEEAKATHEPSKATEAAEAAAVAAVPAAAIVAADKKEDKEEDKTGATTPTEKKNKRASVFGSLFGKKGVTSPTTEKSEKDVGPATPAKDDVPPVSETAPKLDEPIENKPIDTAAVTAPADAIAAESATEEPVKDTVPATTTTEHKTEKKSGFLAGFIKKAEGKKEETKDEKVTEPTATEGTTPAVAETTDGTTETPAAKEERPAREKRRTSLFAGLGTMKRKNKEETSEATEETAATEGKREKSPLPSKIGGLFRKPSKAVKSEEPKEAAATESKTETPAVTEPTAAPTETAAAEEPKPTIVAPENTESKIVGDVVPDELHTVHDAVTTVPEVKATA